jgi:hypothetical protein
VSTAHRGLHQWVRGPMARRLTTRLQVRSLPCSLFCSCERVPSSSLRKIFWWLNRSTDLVVGCSCRRDSARSSRSERPDHQTHGHLAYQISINSSRYLFSCSCTKKTPMFSKFVFDLCSAKIKQRNTGFAVQLATHQAIQGFVG